MKLADRGVELIYRFATTQSRLRSILTPVGAIFWLSVFVVLVLASLWLDRLLPFVLIISSPLKYTFSTLLLLFASVLIIWPVFSFFKARGTPVPINPPRKLVLGGLYNCIRNPIVLGYLVLLYGIGILLGSPVLLFVLAPLFFLANFLYIRTIEEKEMERKFGQKYLDYKKRVPMFIPRLGRRNL